jgi:hypothetical protein
LARRIALDRGSGSTTVRGRTVPSKYLGLCSLDQIHPDTSRCDGGDVTRELSHVTG